ERARRPVLRVAVARNIPRGDLPALRLVDARLPDLLVRDAREEPVLGDLERAGSVDLADAQVNGSVVARVGVEGVREVPHRLRPTVRRDPCVEARHGSHASRDVLGRLSLLGRDLGDAQRLLEGQYLNRLLLLARVAERGGEGVHISTPVISTVHTATQRCELAYLPSPPTSGYIMRRTSSADSRMRNAVPSALHSTRATTSGS